MAKKPRRKQAKKRRRPGGHPGRAARSEEEREIEALIEQVRGRADEALASETPPARVAQIVAEDFEDLASPAGFVDLLLERGSRERARAVVAAVAERAPGSVTALTLAAEAARLLDDDSERARALLGQALLVAGPECDAGLAAHLLEAGDALGAWECLQGTMRDEPEDEDHQQLQARALEELRARAETEAAGLAAREALDAFADRTLINGLSDRMSALVARRPELERHLAEWTEEWLETAQPSPHQDALARLALERWWLTPPDDEEEEDAAAFPEDELGPDLAESRTPLALLTAEPGVSPAVAAAARDWFDTCTSGLWLVEDPELRPGVWLTDIVSGARRYAAIPPEQLAGVYRWGVLLGDVVAIAGVWRTTQTFIPLRPDEGDVAAAVVKDAAADLVRVLEGRRPRGPRRRVIAEPHGVLTPAAEPAAPGFAELVSTATAHLLPALAAEAARVAAQSPRPVAFGSSAEAVQAWSEHWPEEPSPALGGATPRASARRGRDRPILEALLRSLEYDADMLARRGQPVPDFAQLRARLRMERWWE